MSTYGVGPSAAKKNTGGGHSKKSFLSPDGKVRNLAGDVVFDPSVNLVNQLTDDRGEIVNYDFSASSIMYVRLLTTTNTYPKEQSLRVGAVVRTPDGVSEEFADFMFNNSGDPNTPRGVRGYVEFDTQRWEFSNGGIGFGPTTDEDSNIIGFGLFITVDRPVSLPIDYKPETLRMVAYYGNARFVVDGAFMDPDTYIQDLVAAPPVG